MALDPIQRMNLKISAGAVAASLVLASPVFAISMALGSLLEAFNFHGLRRSAQFLVWGEIAGGRGWSGVFALRFGLLALGIVSAIHFGADPVGLTVGLSLIMPAVVIEAWRARPPIDENAPGLEADDPDWDCWNPWLARENDANASEEDDP